VTRPRTLRQVLPARLVDLDRRLPGVPHRRLGRQRRWPGASTPRSRHCSAGQYRQVLKPPQEPPDALDLSRIPEPHTAPGSLLRRTWDALFPAWRYHPFLTNSTLPTAQADITHRRHAIIETVFADLIDGPLAHLPSGHFGANSAWALCAAIAHNLLHAAGTLAGERHARARGATLRRHLTTVPARLARPARAPVLHLPSRWPWAPVRQRLWDQAITDSPPAPA
jgi:hypothetical protein